MTEAFDFSSLLLFRFFLRTSHSCYKKTFALFLKHFFLLIPDEFIFKNHALQYPNNKYLHQGGLFEV